MTVHAEAGTIRGHQRVFKSLPVIEIAMTTDADTEGDPLE